MDVVREEFFSRLLTQTNWGRNQVKELYDAVQRDILSARLSNADIMDRDAISVKDVLVAIDKSYRNSAPKGLYNPGDFITPKPDKDYGDDNPFKDDKDVNKGSL